MSSKQLEVHILQQSYLLACPEGQEARLLEAVERVDTAMTRIRDAGKVRARDRIAVLAALNLAFEIADRESADRAARARAPAPANDAEKPGARPTDDPARLQALLARLDEVLAQDGRLL